MLSNRDWLLIPELAPTRCRLMKNETHCDSPTEKAVKGAVVQAILLPDYRCLSARRNVGPPTAFQVFISLVRLTNHL